MSAGFLPYGSTGSGVWTGSFVASVTTHVAMAAGLYGLYAAAPAPQALEERAAFTVTIETLDTDTLAGTVQDEGLTGSEPVETDPVEAEIVEPEEVETAALDVTEPEAPEAPEPEAVEPEAPDETEAAGDAEEVDAVEPESIEAETAEAIEPEVETAETVEPEAEIADAVEPEAEIAEVVEPEAEALEGVVPDPTSTAEAFEAVEALESLVPDGSTAVAVDETAPELASTVVEPVAPVTDALSASPIAPISESSPIAPELASPIVSDGVGSVAAVAGSAIGLAPVAPGGGGEAPVAVAPTRTTTLAPATPSETAERIAALSSSQSAGAGQAASASRPTRAPPSAQDLALADLIARIRALPAQSCLVALPRRDGEDGVGVAFVSASETTMEDYAQDLLNPGEDVRQTRTLVDPRQCAALDYIRTSADYPATRMGIRADSLRVASGENLTGILRGAAGRHLILLIVDDNGVVQNMQRFVSYSSSLVRFDAPVTRAGGARDTEQILLAIATTRPPSEIRERVGRLAEDVFAGLPAELSSGAALGVATFDVR